MTIIRRHRCRAAGDDFFAQLLDVDRLAHESPKRFFIDARHESRIVRRCENDDPFEQNRMSGADEVENFESIDARHQKIEQHDVRLIHAQEFDRMRSVFGNNGLQAEARADRAQERLRRMIVFNDQTLAG